MITYTWTINNLDRLVAGGFVTQATFRCTATDGINTASITGAASWNEEAYKPIIPYEDLTEELVLGWIKNTVPEIEINLQTTLESMSTQTQASGMPWIA